MTDRHVPDRRSTDRYVPDRRSTDRLNLSRRPFVNSRPVTRAAALLWVLGSVLLLTNVFIIWSYLASSREKRAEVKAGQGGLATERQVVARHEEQVARLDLGRQNEEVAYLNGKIAQRTFSWSRLFDRLAEVLPADVRLQQLTPRGLADERQERQAVRRPATRRTTDLVTLQISGQAKSDEAILEFVDNLFAHPAFAEPNLTHQAHEKDGYIRFAVGVTYLPNAAVAGPVKPPARRWKLAPEPGSQALQAVPPAHPPAPPAPLAPPRVTFAPGGAGAQPPVRGPIDPVAPRVLLRPDPFPRAAPRPTVPQPPGLRGIGTPRRHGSEGSVPDEGSNKDPNGRGGGR
jgi:Tfp pilus assembly protein PilN